MNYKHASTRTKLKEIIERDGNKCKRCGLKWNQIDHIQPKSAGGSNKLENLQLLCTKCHEKKTLKEDLPKIKEFKRALKKEKTIKRLHEQAINWRENKTVELVFPENPFIESLGFSLFFTHTLTTQSMPAYLEFFEKDFCKLFVNGRRFDGWISGERILFKHGLREPLNIKVEWGSMSDRAMCNPAYVFGAELQLIVYEKKLSGPAFLVIE